jgi:hypothetical protein
LTLSILPGLRHRMPMLGAIQAIMDWRGASICTRVDTGGSIGQRHFPRSVCTSKGTPSRRSCHSFRALDRLPKHPVLDQPMIEAKLFDPFACMKTCPPSGSAQRRPSRTGIPRRSACVATTGPSRGTTPAGHRPRIHPAHTVDVIMAPHHAGLIATISILDMASGFGRYTLDLADAGRCRDILNGIADAGVTGRRSHGSGAASLLIFTVIERIQKGTRDLPMPSAVRRMASVISSLREAKPGRRGR